MTYTDITVEHPLSGVTVVAINRPEVRNAYRSKTCLELHSAIEAYVADDSQHVLVLTGTNQSFCSGGDLSSQAEIEAAHSRQFGHGTVMREGMHRVVRALYNCDKPTIAMVDGPAVSGGLALALCCDFRIGSERARMGDVSGSVGLLPDEGGALLFPRAMGADRALRMSLLHEIYDASTARELGLLTDLVSDQPLVDFTYTFAENLAAKAPLAARMAKRLMRHAQHGTLDESLFHAEMAVDIVNESSDVNEGVEAFLAKRPPRFTGA